MAATSRPGRRSTALTPGWMGCSTPWWRVRPCTAARWRASTPPKRSRCRASSVSCRSRTVRLPPTSIRWVALRSSPATPGRPCRAAGRSRSPGTMARMPGTTRQRSRHRWRNRRASPARWSATMEPPAATARIANGKCEVWGGFQSPQAARDLVAKRLGMSADDVTVHVTLLGGGFGRKSKPDYAIEAAVLSKAVDGKPVKVTWTREDDLHNSYYHTVSVEHLEAGVDGRGKPVAWLHRSVAPTIISTFNAAAKNEAPFELGMGVINVPFAIPNVRIENPEATAHTRIGWFRSVSNIPHAFAVQSFVAELAAAAGRDPKDFLLEVIGPARVVSPEMLRHLESRRVARAVSGGHRASAACRGDGGA